MRFDCVAFKEVVLEKKSKTKLDWPVMSFIRKMKVNLLSIEPIGMVLREEKLVVKICEEDMLRG